MVIVRETSTTEAPDGGPSKVPMWPCPTCGTENPLELSVCPACGTPFAALMREDKRPSDVDPKVALRRSLIFPGLGHKALGHGGDGLARAVLFAMTFGLGIVALASGISSGAAATVAALFGGIGLIVYAGTAYEAYHVAGGGRLLLSSRAILWIVVGVLMSSALMLALLITVAARPGRSP